MSHSHQARKIVGLFAATIASTVALGDESPISFGDLPPLPDAEGFAGMYVGVSGGALIAAGGTNFPDKPLAEGGAKRWYDHVFVLAEPGGAWRKLDERLPRPLAHGVAVTHGNDVICVGGADPDAHHRDVFRLRWDGQKLTIAQLPPLPEPAAYVAGAVAGDTLYVAGGMRTPDAVEGTADFWVLDLSAPNATGWRALPSWPGPPRHRAVAAAVGGDFFLFTGVQSEADENGRQRWLRPLLTDAYRYTPAHGSTPGAWTELASLPRAAMAAASPAPMAWASRIMIFGGVNDPLLDADRHHYPGFPRGVLAYDVTSDTWSSPATMPEDTPRVVPGVTHWHGRHVLVSGETAPGRRSPRVIAVTPNLPEGPETGNPPTR